MKAELTGGGVLALAGVAAVAALGFTLYAKRGAIASAAGAAAAAVNPADSGNLVNRAVSAAGGLATGDVEFSLGGWLADRFSPSVAAADRMNKAPLPVRQRPEVDPAISDRWDYYAKAGRNSASGSGSIDPYELFLEATSGTGFPMEYAAP